MINEVFGESVRGFIFQCERFPCAPWSSHVQGAMTNLHRLFSKEHPPVRKAKGRGANAQKNIVLIDQETPFS